MPNPNINRRTTIQSANPLGYPDTIAGLTYLWKADALIANDGDLISSWPDSKSGLTATASGARRPTYKSAIFGTKPVLRFDGTATGMTVSFSIDRTAGGTLFIVTSHTATGTHPQMITSDTWIDQGSGDLFVHDGLVFGDCGNAVPTAKTMVAVLYLTGTADVRYNKAVKGTINPPFTQNFPFVYFGTNDPPTVGWFLGDIAEIIVYSRKLTTAESDGMFDNYLQPKYGL